MRAIASTFDEHLTHCASKMEQQMIEKNNMEHIELVTSLLASLKFHEGARGLEQITLQVPIGESTTHHMMVLINPDTKQIFVDVISCDTVHYSGVFAVGMENPMCPVFKH